MKKSEWYSNLLNSSYDWAIWDLIKNNELLNKKFDLLKNENNDLKNKCNNLIIENENLKKWYDELYIEIDKLKSLIVLNNDLKNSTSSLKEIPEKKTWFFKWKTLKK
jgi:predicted nuclease with TOPRIM domain